VQIDCWLSAIKGGYNYGDLLRDSSPHIKAGERGLNSAESDAAFLERFALPSADLTCLVPFLALHTCSTRIQMVDLYLYISDTCKTSELIVRQKLAESAKKGLSFY